MSDLETVLSALTPERLERIILDIASARAPRERHGVDVSSLVSRLLEGVDLGTLSERSQAYKRAIEAIRLHVARIDGMTYVESRE
ncbi:MAG: hypothetical protein FJZ90_17725 [Chloroflexi bacterium]|nr:hypothetical protein [Chloroflexota bacterium]